MESFRAWDTCTSTSHWTVHTTAKLFNRSYTPDDVIKGMTPRMPTEALLSMRTGAREVSTEQCVTGLVEHSEQVHKLTNSTH